jgi:putative copper resistance protein D
MLDALAAIAQALLYCGIAFSVGAVLARATLRPALGAVRTLELIGRYGACVTIGATLLGLAILALRLGDALDSVIVSAVLISNVGGAAALRLSGSVLLLVTPTDDDGFGHGMQLSAAMLVLASFLFSGHAAAEGIALGALVAVHVAVVAWWVSALIAMRVASSHAAEGAVELVRRFSSLAMQGVAVLVILGIVLVVTLVDFSPFELTAYARNLAIKLALVLLVFGLAAYNKLVLTARVVAHDVAALQRLRKSIDVELALIGLVLVATAIMTTYSSPHE